MPLPIALGRGRISPDHWGGWGEPKQRKVEMRDRERERLGLLMSTDPINDYLCPSFSSSQLYDLGRITIRPFLRINGNAHNYSGGVSGKPAYMVTLDRSKFL